MSTELTVALIAGGASVSTVVTNGLVSYFIARQTQRSAERKEVERTLKTYRDPLMRSAYDLQSRLWNIVTHEFFRYHYLDGTEDEKEYAILNTLYVVAEYLGWGEVIRRDVQFIDLGKKDKNRQLVRLDEAIRECLLASEDVRDSALQLLRGQQRAIGEIMILPNTDPSECMGYVRFTEVVRDRTFSKWFGKLRADIETIATTGDQHYERLIALQRALVDLLDFLDPEYLRFSKELRTKLQPKA